MRGLKSIILSGIVGMGILWWVLRYVHPEEVVGMLSKIDHTLLFFFLGLAIFHGIIKSYKWKLIIKSLGYELPLLKLYWYAMTGFTVGYLLPASQFGSEPAKAILLKRDKVPFSSALSSVVIEVSIGFTVNILLGSALAILLLARISVPGIQRVIYFGVFVVIGYVLWRYFKRITDGDPVFSSFLRFFRIDRGKWGGRILLQITTMEERVMEFLNNDRATLWKVVLISVASAPIMFLEFWLALRIIGHVPSLLEAVLVAGAYGLSSVVPIPGAVGVQEAGQAAVGSLVGLVGYTSPTGVAVSLVMRARDLMAVGFGVLFFIFKGPDTGRKILNELMEARRAPDESSP